MAPAFVSLLRQTAARGRSFARGVKTNFFWDPNSTQSLTADLQRWALERPDDPFLSFEGRRWTIGSFDAQVNRHARAWRALGLEAGQVVAVLLENRPAFLFHFYALAKLGVITSLINTSSRGPALRHALRVCEPAAIVLGDAQLEAVQTIADDLPVDPGRVFVDVELSAQTPDWTPLAEALDPDTGGPGWSCWNPQLVGRLPLPLPTEAIARPLSSLAAYIYTSGTTGLPKPALVEHHRLRRACDVFGALSRFTAQDCMYVALPLYHASGSMIGVSVALGHRGRLVLARRFSARRFWTECADTGVTVCMYIGELCRYLHNTPPGPDDTRHQVRCFVGNGLREDIWGPFVERFGIARVVEFYAATEGNAETANLFNLEGTVGPFLFWKMALARWDEQRGALYRDAQGRCVRAELGQPGLLLGRIDAANPYAGYTDAEASERKVLRDLFKPGDAWFDTGDLLRADRFLHLHFVDRLGDTFRWKGENVSTQEVAEQLNAAPGVRESNVYGVEVPGHEGRAGMAALVVEDDFDPARLFAFVAAMPDYAQPRFVRLVQSMGTTETFKHVKVALRTAGWDPGSIDDPLLLRDLGARTYRPLDEASRRAVLAGEWAL